MKKILPILFLLLFVTAVANAADRYAVSSGNWNSTATWSTTSGGASGASAPVAGDNVFIEGGFTVTITADAACANLTVGTATNGTLIIGNGGGDDLTVSGNIIIASGSTIDGGNDGNLNVAGNITNDGIFNPNNGGNDINVVFNGTTNQSFSGTGGTSDFNLITINNTGTAGNNIVEISSSIFTVPSGFLTLTDGIFKLSGSFTLSNTFFNAGSYNINANSGFWLNNANVTVTGQNGSPDLDGMLRITAGTFNLGNTAGNTLNMDNGSSFIMEGGTYTSTGRIQPQSGTDAFTIDISGGTITLATLINNTGSNAIFQITDSDCIFNMSGGTIIIQNSNTSNRDYENAAGTYTITGGTVQFGNASTPTSNDNFDIGQSTAAVNHIFPSLSIVDNGTSVPTVTIAATNPSITVRGNINIAAGTTFNANSRPVSVTGTFTNDGNFTPGTQTITFNGTAAQSIDGASATALSSLTIDNAAGVTLNQDVSVSGTMTFTNGVVTSSSANMLTINDEATVAGADNDSYVDGPVTKLGNNDFTFPVGDPAGSYHRLRLVNTGGANGDSYTAEYFRASARALATSVSAPLFGVSNCEYWTLSRNAGSSTPNLFVSWTADSPCPTSSTFYVTSLTGLVVARLNGSVWELANGTNQAATGTVGVGGDGNVADNGISLFGTFALGNTEAEQNPLPVKIGSIKAYEKSNGVQIDWTAYSEMDLDRYIIERSANGQYFTAIGDVVALNSTAETRYGFFDANPLPGVSFYRLRNLDIDGKSGYSNIVRVDLNKGNLNLTVYPNPARSNGYLSYSASQLARGYYHARIFNSAGQQVLVQPFSHNGGAINQTIQLPVSVRPGLYTLQLESEGMKLSGKTFMVQ